ncbi:hypothetical protein EST38_g5915 [Candolleomyces aberdarensis]|uniref:F-box domain-containing protein n=1 Tax=Candolleomyces aberdarensis TaxID=2316362 RepID=A0A4Q2DJ76_9AGAR|nr:hypothetical protein EST38_g5915 [Candolleomyces aberdarensis]
MPSLLDMPAEIQLYIFEFAAALDGLPHSNPGRTLFYSTAVAISHVHPRIRQLVLSAPCFWCNIPVVFPEYPFPDPSDWIDDPIATFEISKDEQCAYERKIGIILDGVMTWVSRSGNRPLTLRIDAEPMIKRLCPYTTNSDPEEIDPDNNICTGLDDGVFSAADPLIEYLVGLSTRWGELSSSLPIVSTDTRFRQLLKIRAENAPCLRKLQLQIDFDQYSRKQERVEETMLDKLLKPSDKYHLNLSLRPYVKLQELPINWSAVTHLNLSAPDYHFPETDDAVQAADFSLLCIKIIGRCLNVECCEITMPLLWTEPDLLELEVRKINKHSYCLPSLKSLTIRNLSQVAVGFGRCLDLPCLENLALTGEYAHPDLAGVAKCNLIEFATRFGPQLTTATIHRIDLTQEELYDCSMKFQNVSTSFVDC